MRVGFERDGSHAQYALVPAANLYPIADHVPFDQAAILPDAVACMYHAIADVARVSPGERALVYGIGGLGLQGVQLLKRFGATIFAAGRTKAKLELAERLGVDALIQTSTEDLQSAVLSLTEGYGADVAFDLVGNDESCDLMLSCVRPGGRVVSLAYAVDRFSGNYQEMVIKEKEILGVRGSTRQNMLDVIDLVERGEIAPIVTAHYNLAEINEALDALRESRGLGRSVLLMED